ncbi:MAG: trehalose-phosphatase [Candidatus Hadarchaeaceae archaeon]
MRHLWNILDSLRKNPDLFWFLDYDGTLTPIVSEPEKAVLDPEKGELLAVLAEKFKLAVISGRRLRELNRLVPVRKVWYAGNHGLEISGPGGSFVLPGAARVRPTVLRICQGLQDGLEGIAGAVVENKGLTASLHYRKVAPTEVAKVKKIFETIVYPYVKSGSVRITKGRRVWEIRPNYDWDKGRAVDCILRSDPLGEFLPVYLGDDRTDEDAFIALRGRGITVLVARNRRRTNAEFYLRGVEEVKILLRTLAA